MAEFCLKCFNALNGTDFQAPQVWLEKDFCEGCGDWQPCVFQLQPKPLHRKLRQSGDGSPIDKSIRESSPD